MSSIDFIDEAGREWAHASRYRALEDENAALRKRVKELEGVINPALEGLERAGWPCRLQELPDLYNKLAAEFLGMKARAEKAEASLESYQASAHNYVLKHQECAKLKADLDAALTLLGLSLREENGLTCFPGGPGSYDAQKRIQPLLEKRREGRG